jgi:UDP-N-acetyl-D-glucosamine/UDP-N-acetyl-D-galactosamine dehydrogenase
MAWRWVGAQLACRRAGQAGLGAVLGLTFKENVPDLRNSKVADLVPNCKRWATR